MKKKVIFALILNIVFCAGCGSSILKVFSKGFTELNAEQSVEMLKNEKDILVIDVSSEKEVVKKPAHITGSIWIPEDQLPARINEIAVYKDKKVICVCPCGKRSRRVSGVLAKNGFKHVYNISAGVPGLVKVPGAPIDYTQRKIDR